MDRPDNERVNGSLGLLDMTPYGRREAWEDNPEGWPEAPQSDSPLGGHGSAPDRSAPRALLGSAGAGSGTGGGFLAASGASGEEDLPTPAALHDLLRRVGLLRLARGELTPTRAAGDDLQTVRRLRRAFEPDGFDDTLTGVATAHLADRGGLPRAELAALTHPWLDRWAISGRPVTPADVDTRLSQARHLLEALDLVQVNRSTWHPGPAAQTLLPRATALAHLFRREQTRA